MYITKALYFSPFSPFSPFLLCSSSYSHFRWFTSLFGKLAFRSLTQDAKYYDTNLAIQMYACYVFVYWSAFEIPFAIKKFADILTPVLLDSRF